MKKLRIQPSFASLTEDELEQLACMVQLETLAIVLERARKPRSEGGFGLTLRSESPLERLLDKKNKLDLINAQITNGRKLTLTQLNTFTAGDSGPCGEHRAPIGLSGSDIHDAIMSATYILVTEHDNTPHQLLALQRLADFPERAALRTQSAEDLSRLREQSAQIRAERLEISRSKENRAKEMHTHKIALDLRKQTLKEKTTAFRLNSNPFSSPDEETTHHSSPITHDSVVRSSTHDSSPITHDLPSPSFPSRPSVKSFLSPEVIANNRLYDQKIDCGEIRLIFAPGKHYEIEYCNPADKPALERMHKSPPLRFFEDPTRTTFLPALRTFGKNPHIPPQNTHHSSLMTHHLKNTFGKNPYIPPTNSPSTNGGTSRARSAELSSVLASESPTSTSRDAITPTTATPSHDSSLMTHHIRSAQPSTSSDPTLRAEPDKEMNDARHAMRGRATNCAVEHAGDIARVADNFGSGQAR